MLLGFFFYVMIVVNWGNWPWAQLQLRQPWLGVGVGQISLLILPICTDTSDPAELQQS